LLSAVRAPRGGGDETKLGLAGGFVLDAREHRCDDAIAARAVERKRFFDREVDVTGDRLAQQATRSEEARAYRRFRNAEALRSLFYAEIFHRTQTAPKPSLAVQPA